MTRLELLQQCEAFIRGFEGDEMQYDAPVESMLEGLRAEIKVERDREEPRSRISHPRARRETYDETPPHSKPYWRGAA